MMTTAEGIDHASPAELDRLDNDELDRRRLAALSGAPTAFLFDRKYLLWEYVCPSCGDRWRSSLAQERYRPRREDDLRCSACRISEDYGTVFDGSVDLRAIKVRPL